MHFKFQISAIKTDAWYRLKYSTRSNGSTLYTENSQTLKND